MVNIRPSQNGIGRLMSVALYFNGQHRDFAPGVSLFDCAEAMAIKVPTSCRKNGKCKGMPGRNCRRKRLPVAESSRGATSKETSDCPVARTSPLTRGQYVVTQCAVARCALNATRSNSRPATNVLSLIRCYTRWRADSPDGQEIARSAAPIHGLAMDLGTTTVVLRLLNLETGEVVADASFENPQRFGGSDVMARIQYDTEDGTRVLQRTVVGYLNHAIEEFPVEPETIYELVVAGNSTMRDLFFRLNVYPIGQSPYRSITELDLEEGKRTSTSLSEPAKRLGIRIHPKARIYGLPIISGHVGADAAACMLGIDLANEERTVAIMDIGTNTELIIGNKHKILAASCPAGPAFEGGKIACGMPGLPGAIERVRIDGEGAFQCAVIGGGEPEGICGSGMIDLLGELLRTSRINSLGRLEDGDRVVIAEADGQDIFFTESDINELAQAKGANVAGLRVVFADYGIRFDELDVFYLAGGSAAT